MVPVRLELQNFLSYGTEAPPLDFEGFEVACLSGGNGEGKSALLDAMTWAVWGEARKSSGKRKPDDELIRIGTRHMEVAFTFDLEATRYRVTRSFSRSATGKTTTSDLEFQLHDPEGDGYRPLTGATQRETQARIEDTIGLDYDTFINSAFLLQGRSDEFTKKSPSQRKQILVSILNLSRYEALEAKARDRWREEKQRQQRIEAEVERLQEALSEVSEWEEERAEVRDQISEQQEHLEALRSEQQALTEQRADLDAKEREATSIQESLEALNERREEHQEEIDTLNERIAEADELLEQQEEIEAAYEQYEDLKEERDALDEKRDLHRGLEKQIERKEADLRERRNELERRLDRLKMERKGLEESLNECKRTLARRPDVKRALRDAQAARQHLQEYVRLRRRREHLESRRTEAKEAIVGAREQLRGELEPLREQIKKEQEVVETRAELTQRLEDLEAKKARRETLRNRLEKVEAQGKKISEAVQEQAGQLELRKEEREQELDELQRFRQADGEACPTCGTELTDSHRQEVITSFETTIQELEGAIGEREQQLQEKVERRKELRERYADLQEELDALEGVGEALATVREQLRTVEETAEALEKHKAQATELQRRLQAGDFGHQARREWQYCQQRLAALTYDSEGVQDLQNRAAQVDRYVERWQELEEADARRERLEQKIDQQDEEIQSVREQLDEGTPFEDLQEDLDELREQLETLDFDPERFQDVRKQMRELSDASSRMGELKNARQNRADWVEQRERLHQRIEETKEEQTDYEEQLSALREALEEKQVLEEKQEKLSSEIQDVEETVSTLQQRLGNLEARLEQAERDRTSLEQAKEEREEAERQRGLYKHLRTAFGKHGIPSLIIEETLPEIEERANQILEQLTDGRMHVRLETLREKKSGGTKETLEIIISDEQGVPRPYETFSGGESFRVNFALRVALAQLLAERSGVRVRTLVIDEGFGTQDEEGIERLVDAIQTIRGDFAKILVITHLERLKQAFPVRIEVEKDPAIGSTFELVGV